MRRRRHEPETVSGDRWLLSYADFITLLFALFVVLFATAYRDNHSIKRISESIHNGFQAMGAFAGGQSEITGKVPNSQSYVASEGTASAPKGEGDVSESAGTGVNIVELRQQLEAAIGKELRDGEVVIRNTPEGFVVSLRELGFFNSGEAVLLPGSAEKIERIAGVLMKHGLALRVEGHSDDQPIHNDKFRSNWELSTARAMTVLLLLVNDAGFDPHKISVMGCGQYRPVADNSTPAGRRTNRRVDLVVVAPVAPQAGAP